MGQKLPKLSNLINIKSTAIAAHTFSCLLAVTPLTWLKISVQFIDIDIVFISIYEFETFKKGYRSKIIF